MSLFRPLGYPIKPQPCIIRIRNLTGNFEHISKTHSLREHEYVDINAPLHPPLWLHNYATWANYMSNVYMIKDYGSWNLKILIS